MLMTLLSMLGGGLMRLLPEALRLLDKRADHAHELAMLDRQVELEKTRAAGNQHAIREQGDVAEALATIAAQQAASGAQMTRIGVAWIDAMTFLVRPMTTYYFLAFYGGIKAAMVVIALRAPDPWMAIVQCWNEDDRAVLSAILSFWFVSRCVEKRQR